MGRIIYRPSKSEMKVKTPEQKEFIEKFFLHNSSGCAAMFDKPMEGEIYLRAVKEKVKNLNVKNMAINRLGIDIDEINAIEPLNFSSFNFSGDYYARDVFSSKYEVTWIFFSAEQVFAYRYIFDMTSDSSSEIAEEYFYKDIVSFTTTQDSYETIKVNLAGCLNKETAIKGSVDINKFVIKVPGDSFQANIEDYNDIVEKSIQRVKGLLREKKNA